MMECPLNTLRLMALWPLFAHTAVDFTANLSVGDTISINGVTFATIANGGSPTATRFALGTTLAATLDVISALTVTGVALTDDNTD